jgi:hypothetical protein
MMTLIELFHELLAFVLNCSVEIPVAYQNKMSVITLVTVGDSMVRTKHMRARMRLAIRIL